MIKKDLLIKEIDKQKNSVKKGNKFIEFLVNSIYFKDLTKNCNGLVHDDKSGDKGVDLFFWDANGNPHVWQSKYKDSYTPSSIDIELNKLLSNIENGRGEICKNIQTFIKNSPQNSNFYFHFFTLEEIGSSKEKEKMEEAVSNYKKRLGTNLIFSNVNYNTLQDFEAKLVEDLNNIEYSFPVECFVPTYSVKDPNAIAVINGTISYRQLMDLLIAYANDHFGSIHEFFQYNCRAGLIEDSSVNKNIKKTLEENTELLLPYNMGITHMCKGIRREGDKYFIKNPYSINGCQTTNVLYNFAMANNLLQNDRDNRLETGHISCKFNNSQAFFDTLEDQKLFESRCVTYNNSFTKINKLRAAIAPDYRARKIKEIIWDKYKVQLITKDKEIIRKDKEDRQIPFDRILRIYESTINKYPGFVYSRVNDLSALEEHGSKILDDIYNNMEVGEYCFNLQRQVFNKYISPAFGTDSTVNRAVICIFHVLFTMIIQQILGNITNAKLMKTISDFSNNFAEHDGKYSIFFIKLFNLILNDKNDSFLKKVIGYSIEITHYYFGDVNNAFSTKDYSSYCIVTDFKDKKGNNSGTFKIATRGFKVENGFKNTPGLKNILQLEPFNPKKEDIEYIENLLMSMKK